MLVTLAEAVVPAAALAETLPPIPGPADGFLPILLIVVIAAGFAFSQILATQLLGPRRMGALKSIPYESGVDPVGDTKQPFVVQYYLVALLFLLFDVELAFLYPWAVSFRSEAEKGSAGYAGLYVVGMAVFLGVLILAFVYEWLKGILDWNPRKPQLAADETPDAPTTK